jgi:hypothetical protein
MEFLLRCRFLFPEYYFRNIFEIPASNLSGRVLNSFQQPVDVMNQKKSNRNGKDKDRYQRQKMDCLGIIRQLHIAFHINDTLDFVRNIENLPG